MAYEGPRPYTIVGPSLRHSKTSAWIRLTCFYFNTGSLTYALCALYLGWEPSCIMQICESDWKSCHLQH
ncbi:hypothetical protein BU23DRAFT_559516 [Bimuria novae-zelandiae CBS 107.79]|uniref:Uncharacterized protein n=1 Tax=Bimuria novae-zelandiae CBS 107.79 TaxID=1447943 RepID=A0A6A5UQV5_9PLEO|nr:hypothetical protein BU23DRAFT_559516 [Bimuria novae-zelandiae CBS 107.79]